MDVAVKAVTRVAIVEEVYLIRRTLASLLTGSGFEVVGQFPALSDLLRRFGLDRPGLALYGVLATADGEPTPEAVSEFHQLRERDPDLKVVVLTQSTSSEQVERWYRLGAHALLDRRTATETDVVRSLRAAAQGERLFPTDLFVPHSSREQAAPESPVLQGLSLREREVLSYVAAGADNLKIAAMLRISERTVKAHVSSLYRKIGSENRTQLALAAAQLGLRPASAI